MSVLLALGNWQLQRAEEKRQIKQQQIAQAMRPPATLSELKPEQDIRYRQVVMKGQFVGNRNFLLDNRVRSGRVGYEVIAPFLLNTGEHVLVNRGWLPAPRLRTQRPDIPQVSGVVALTGVVYQPLHSGQPNPGYIEQGQDWPKVIQHLDHTAMAAELGVTVPPFTVRMQQGVPGSLDIGWPVVNVQPEKHVAYAVQWFFMALALLVLTVLTNTNLLTLRQRNKKIKEADNDR